MFYIMPHNFKNFISIPLFFFLLFFVSCKQKMNTPTITLPSEEEIKLVIVRDLVAQTKGMSGILEANWPDGQGMFFFYEYDDIRSFWMPDTYMDLDIFFLDKEFRVIEISRSMKAYPGKTEPPAIDRTPDILCRHVLELKSSDPISKKISVGTKLLFRE